MSSIEGNQTLSRAQRVKKTIIWVIKHTLTFLFSHVGLTSAVVGYVILGGVIFMAIEKRHELEQRERVGEHRKAALEELEKVIMEFYFPNTTESLMMNTSSADVLSENMTSSQFTSYVNVTAPPRSFTITTNHEHENAQHNPSKPLPQDRTQPIVKYRGSSDLEFDGRKVIRVGSEEDVKFPYDDRFSERNHEDEKSDRKKIDKTINKQPKRNRPALIGHLFLRGINDFQRSIAAFHLRAKTKENLQSGRTPEIPHPLPTLILNASSATAVTQRPTLKTKVKTRRSNRPGKLRHRTKKGDILHNPLGERKFTKREIWQRKKTAEQLAKVSVTLQQANVQETTLEPKTREQVKKPQGNQRPGKNSRKNGKHHNRPNKHKKLARKLDEKHKQQNENKQHKTPQNKLGRNHPSQNQSQEKNHHTGYLTGTGNSPKPEVAAKSRAEEQQRERKLKEAMMAVMRRLENKTWQMTTVHSWDGHTEQTAEVQWSFAGAMLYSVTVVTTIGQYVCRFIH
ncbi:hypothetical protein ACOMHN_042320 [Nucella lapillus]